ncbi:kinesin light chain [Aspergillus arachidicola]|uniref:Kinesin light chain n=1 Tax=Aspergillus arachidicola TaxID=656916 RepID=A0A2G7FJ24_9EURO|nr:kinesin light chain [Aspergillus arachidicola]
MVGIGGGVPSKEADIRLGNVVVSQPGNGHGGVVQYNFGKSTPSGFKRTGFLNTPPTILLAAVTKLRSNLDRGKSSLSPHLSKLGNLPKFGRDQAGSDFLFKAEYNHSGEDSCLSLYKANGQVKEAVKLLEHVVVIESELLAEDHPSRLTSQHALATAYEANGQINEAVKLLEYVVAIRTEVLAGDHPDRLASQHALAGAYQANGQIKEAVKLLEHVVAIESEVLAEDHPSRLLSERTLAAFYKDLMKRSRTRLASATLQAMSENNITSTALSDQSPAEQDPKLSYKSKGRLFVRQLKGFLKKVN